MRTLFALVAVAVLVGGLGLAYVRTTGLRAQAEPGALETMVARRVRAFAVPDDMKALPNPLPANDENVRAGMEHFAKYCAMCHGNDGSGLKSAIGRGLFPKPPNMTTNATQQLTDGELFYIIENGVRFTGMPAFGDGKTDGPGANLAWQLVHFVRRLPRLTPDEIGEMETMNPL
ncbi:MAG: cytochrome c [Vicinamibacterales bacterium]